jgi:prepilin-type N-terminal cleavage/methylation domain-containing protein
VKISSPRSPASAFTLIELVISAAIGAMILTGAYLCLSAGLAGQKIIGPRADLLQTARVSLAMISADLRAACPLDKDFAFLGVHRVLEKADADNLDFATHNYTPRHDREGDFCETSYFMEKDKKSGQYSLWRRRNPTLALDPLSGGKREEIAPGLRGLKFEYTDGQDWYDTWGQTKEQQQQSTSVKDVPNLSGMPEAVRVTLYFASDASNNAPPLVFQTIARLELADASQPAATGNDTDTSTNAPTSPGGGAD